MRWRPHTDHAGRRYALNHLHPFRFDRTLCGARGATPLNVAIHVGFGLHCFTRTIEPGATVIDPYTDDREAREFDAARYEHSRNLPAIIRSLADRHCGFGHRDNFVTIDLVNGISSPVRYAVFFSMKRWRRLGQSAVLLVVQSAYVLDERKRTPSEGRIRFDALLRHALAGTRAKKPR
jgi:hypothetical protein